jgi:SAM-dependent methyltransferase
MGRHHARLASKVGRSIFGDDARQYHEARADYPRELYADIESQARFPIQAILEIGAGTGLATQDLFKLRPQRYRAVEPDPVLAAHLARRFHTPSFGVVEDIFPAVGVDGPFDLIAAASSFHWTDQEAALDAIMALLSKDGMLALWWNVYRQPGIGDAFADAVEPLLEGLALPPSEAGEGHYSLETANRLQQLRDEGFLDTRHSIFRRERVLNPAQARALFESYSFVRTLPTNERSALLAAVESIVRKRFGGAAPCQVLTPLYIAHKR